MHENEISYLIRKAIFQVYNNLGPGLLESVYCKALADELKSLGLQIKHEVSLPYYYKNNSMHSGFRIDILVEEKVIIEVKSVKLIAEIHHKQVLTYLRLSGLKLGLLVNFNSSNISKSIFRKVNNL